VSDTPRTESFNCYDNGCDNPLHAWGAFSAELERELNAANDRIKRLEDIISRSKNKVFRHGSNGTAASGMLDILGEVRKP
jgi:hypothetical protein